MARDQDDLEKSLEKLSASEPVHLTEDGKTGDRFLIYGTQHGIEVRLRFDGESLWMTQAQMADLFGRDTSVISRHISNVLEEGELEESTSLQKMQTSAGRPATLYSLDMVISVGYRVSSSQATMFRKWATAILVQFATKGFVIDAPRLKEPDFQSHFKELRETIREIRSSEANLFRELRNILALCSDYDALDDHRKNSFFATVQNKLLFAVTGMTAAEIRVDRANAAKENMGLAIWKGRNVGKADVMVAKNYLGELEIRDLNRFNSMLLDYFEQETELQRLVLTQHAEAALDKFIRNNERQLLIGVGSKSKKEADLYCEGEYAKYDDMRKERYLQSPDEEPDV